MVSYLEDVEKAEEEDEGERLTTLPMLISGMNADEAKSFAGYLERMLQLVKAKME